MSRTQRFDDAVASITQERGEAYGHPLDAFGKAVMIKRSVSSCPDPEVRHVLEMIGVKLARLATTPDHLDSLIDIAGYARTAAMLLDERELRRGAAMHEPDCTSRQQEEPV
tara:strand:- start:36 stop:368 length:333 start_codon:yes stop_codon:yes gene_type:complete